MTSKNLELFLTVRECDALLTLGTCRAAWRTFDPRTWQSLAAKGLVAFGVAPSPTAAGKLAISLTRALRHVNEGFGRSDAKAPQPGRVMSEPDSRAALNTLVSLRNLRP